MNYWAKLLLLLSCTFFAQFAYCATQPIDKNALSKGGEMRFTSLELCDSNRSCKPVVFAEGWINENALQNFKPILNQLPEQTTIYLNSDGGDLIAGIDFGTLIRSKKWDSRIGSISPKVGKSINSSEIASGRCISACMLAFIGGVKRQINSTDVLGFHGLIKVDTAPNKPENKLEVEQAKKAIAALGQYIQLMGVDRRLTDFMLFAQGDKFQRIPYDNARKLGIDNQVGQMYSPWRLQALDNGALLATNNEKQENGKYVVVIGLSKPSASPPTNEKLRCIIFLKPFERPFSDNEFLKILAEKSAVEIITTKGSLSGKTVLSNWQKNGDGAQIILEYPAKELDSLAQFLSFDVEIAGVARKYNLESLTHFGTNGLKGVLKAIKN